MITFINEDRETFFRIYKEFKRRFLRYFTDSNSVNNAIKKLMNLR